MKKHSLLASAALALALAVPAAAQTGAAVGDNTPSTATSPSATDQNRSNDGTMGRTGTGGATQAEPYRSEGTTDAAPTASPDSSVSGTAPMERDAGTAMTREPGATVGTDTMGSSPTGTGGPALDTGREGTARDTTMGNTTGSLSVAQLEDAEIEDATGEEIGGVDRVLTDESGNPNQVVLSVGGFLGIGERTVAVSVDRLSMAPALAEQRAEGEAVTLRLDMTREQIEALPAWREPEGTESTPPRQGG